jgi:hypothetical protein
MLVNRSFRKFVALALACAAAAAVTGGALRAQAVASTTSSQGNPHAVPPILRAATRSELAAIRRQEAREEAAFSYRLPVSAQYSSAEMDAYATVCKGGC